MSLRQKSNLCRFVKDLTDMINIMPSHSNFYSQGFWNDWCWCFQKLWSRITKEKTVHFWVPFFVVEVSGTTFQETIQQSRTHAVFACMINRTYVNLMISFQPWLNEFNQISILYMNVWMTLLYPSSSLFWCDIILRNSSNSIIQLVFTERWSACGWSSPSAILLWSWPSMVVLASGTPVLWHECFGWSDWYVKETWMNQWCVSFRGKLLYNDTKPFHMIHIYIYI